jgi:hypothetical protein
MSGFAGGPSGARARDGVFFVSRHRSCRNTVRWPQGIVVLSPAGKSPPENHRRRNLEKTAAARGDPPPGLTQKRMLETKLEGRRWTALCGEHGLEMFDRVQQWIGLGAGRRRLCAAQPRAPVVQPPAQPASQAIHRLQRKRQAPLLRRRLERKPRQQLQQPRPHQRGRQGVTRQHLRQQERKSFPTTAPLPAIGTKHPLAAHPLRTGPGGIIAAQETVPVQRFDALAAWTALLLEGKSASFSAGSSRTK